MKVKVGDRVYTSKDCPIMVILTEKDKFNIAHMSPEATKYAEFDDELGMTKEEKEQWMDNENTEMTGE